MARKGMTQARKDRAAKVLQLRDSGVDFARIAKSLGVSETTVRNDYDKALEEARPDTAVRVFGKIDRRLERLQLAYWKQALEGDMKAARLILDIQKELGELWGVKGAVKLEVSTAGQEWEDVLTSIRSAAESFTDDEIAGHPNEPAYGDPSAADEGR